MYIDDTCKALRDTTDIIREITQTPDKSYIKGFISGLALLGSAVMIGQCILESKRYKISKRAFRGFGYNSTFSDLNADYTSNIDNIKVNKQSSNRTIEDEWFLED